MTGFKIVAHRGVPGKAPENTLRAFQRAVELGADAVEMDVRLTSDRVPVIFHYYYLDETTSLTGPIFKYTAEELSRVRVRSKFEPVSFEPIPTLRETLDTLAGKIGLEIELKGPEPECAEITASLLKDYQPNWEKIEVTSFEPSLLQIVHEVCPDLVTDLLFPRSESWMKLDVVAYQAHHRSRLAGARAVHLNPTQLSEKVVSTIRKNGVEIHAWDVNSLEALQTCYDFGIPQICTDKFQQAFDFRERAA